MTLQSRPSIEHMEVFIAICIYVNPFKQFLIIMRNFLIYDNNFKK